MLWICPSVPSDLPSLEVKFMRFSVRRLFKLRKRIKAKKHPVVTDIWYTEPIPLFIKSAIRLIFHDCYLPIKKF